MISRMNYLRLPLLLFLVAVAVGCGSEFSGNDSASFASAPAPAGAPGMPGNPGAPGGFTTQESAAFDRAEEGFASANSALLSKSDVATPAAPRPSPQVFPGERGSAGPTGPTDSSLDGDEGIGGTTGGGDIATLVQQNRIIVRTVDMSIVVPTVATSVDEIGNMAEEMGGWLVSSNRSEENRGFVSIRVPAERLDEAILRLRAMADEVRSEIMSSRDVTDEYFDTQARLTNLEATEGALLKLLDRAEKVEDALSIQESLTRVQEDIERFQGRIKLLEQTAAFSLINVSLELVKGKMSVDAAEDKTTGVGELVRFRATFTPPQDIEDFFYTWDFGDGSPVISSNRTAPTEDDPTRVTATITHVYNDERDSPYIAEIKMSGFGEAGEVEGEDTLIVTVSRAPIIEVFAGEGLSVDAGETVQLSGSFTRPTQVSNIKYVWDFGDGSSPVEGTVQEGVTTVVAEHVYPNNRPFPYTVRLTVTAESDTGDVEASSTSSVFVREPLGWVVAGWDIEDQGKGAARSLSIVGQGLITFGIWFAIFAPLWVVVLVLVVVFRRKMSGRNSSGAAPQSEEKTGDA
jgi:hypothetical protein